MICAEDDFALPPALAEGMEAYVPRLEKRLIRDCGHWTQQEKPEELNALLVDWLTRTFPRIRAEQGAPSDPASSRRRRCARAPPLGSIGTESEQRAVAPLGEAPRRRAIETPPGSGA
jgi:hypothetical protein